MTTETMERDGRLIKVGDHHGVTFERRLAHSPERVWKAITDRAELRSWFPAEITGDLSTAGAELTFAFREDEWPSDTGEVTESDEPRVLAFTWGEQSIRYELEPDGDGCRLTFTHLLPFDETAKVAAGWQLCFVSLEQHLAERPIGEFDEDRYTDLHDGYAEEFGVDPEIGRRSLEDRRRAEDGGGQ
jgi:uncharacterized protein YndB with AHSA1/START domain